MVGRILRLAFASIAIIGLSKPSVAADLDLLTRLLIPGYIAQDFASACSLEDSDFFAGGVDGFASVRGYAEHLKKEITFNLSGEDALKVQQAAANVAGHVARTELRRRAIQPSVDSGSSVRAWCDTVARKLILGLVATHISKHRKFDLLVSIATTK